MTYKPHELALSLLLVITAHAQQYAISTVAGQQLGDAPVPGTEVAIGSPAAIAMDPKGSVYFVSSVQAPLEVNILLLKLDRNGILTRVAGGTPGYSGDGGPAAAATFRSSLGMAIDAQGNIYLADTGNNRVRKISADGTINTVAGNGAGGAPTGDGGLATNATVATPWALAVDPAGNLYIVAGGYAIRMVSPSGIVTTVAGTGVYGSSGDGGPAAAAQIGDVGGLAVDASGNLYFSEDFETDQVIDGADIGGDFMRVRKISAADGTITTVAGSGPVGFSGDGGPATAANLNLVGPLTFDAAGNLYMAEYYRIRMVTPKGIITTIAGNGASYYSLDGVPAISSGAVVAAGLATDNSGNLYFTDPSYPSGRVRKISENILLTVAGLPFDNIFGDGGAAPLALLYAPVGVAIDSIGGIYISDTYNYRIRRVAPAGDIETFAGSVYSPLVSDPTPIENAHFLLPGGLALNGAGNLYIADSGNGRIRMASGGMVTTLAGSGTQPGFSGDGGLAVNALLNWPKDLALDGAGNIYIADTGNNRIRVVNAAGMIHTIAGTSIAPGYGGDQGPAIAAKFNLPSGIAVDGGGNVYVADTGNFRVRRISASGTIATIAGTGASGHTGDGGPAALALLYDPLGIKLDAAGNLYIADGNSVRMINPAGIITTIAGTGVLGFSGDGGLATSAQMGAWGLAFDNAGNLFVADPWNNVIRKLTR